MVNPPKDVEYLSFDLYLKVSGTQNKSIDLKIFFKFFIFYNFMLFIKYLIKILKKKL